jgi:hypothetical protein
VAEHSIESDHRIEFHEPEVLAKTSGHMNRLVKEAITVKLHPDNIVTRGMELVAITR